MNQSKPTRSPLKSATKAIINLFSLFGISPIVTAQTIFNMPWYVRDWIKFRRLETNPTLWPFATPHPRVLEKHDQSGGASGHYFHQDLWAAQKIFARNPKRHIDVGSRIDGFVAHVAAFREIEVADIRPLEVAIPNIRFFQIDITGKLAPEHVACCDSLSCLHVMDHFGLGRYNDPIDPGSYRRGLANLAAMIEAGGRFYFSVPIGPQRIEFNANRVYSIEHLLELFAANHLSVITFSYVRDRGDLIKNATLTPEMIASNCGVWYGCGIFELERSL